MPSRRICWAEGVDLSCAKLVEEFLTKRPHPQQGFRSSLGVQRLADEKKHGKSRMGNAYAQALRRRVVSDKAVVAILQHQAKGADENHADTGRCPSTRTGAAPTPATDCMHGLLAVRGHCPSVLA
ncbi:hypothetical protein BHS06_22115 [Myxococcus xanthus]|nr:hypothetical protein BHS06_22115 [Myxococcus xanthus]